jgi:hypothetical protein
MIWDDIRRTFEDYFSREEFSFDIFHADDPDDTECTAVLKIDAGPREQEMTLILESEDSIKYIRVLSPVVSLEKCSKEQLIRLMEQNVYWVQTRVGVDRKKVVFTTLVSLREFEADPAALGDAMTNLARRADQMESLLFGRDLR